MKNKKSQGLSVNMIVIAAIALIVLIVVIAIFADKAGFFSRNVGGSCQDKGGKFSLKCEDEGTIRVIAKGCDKDGNTNSGEEGPCCVPIT